MKISVVAAFALALSLLSKPMVARASTPAAPAHPIKVFVLAGQSNMEGKGDGAMLTAADQERLARARTHVELAFNLEPVRPLHFREASEALQKKFGTGPQIFGPEMFFGICMSEAWPDEKILLIKRAVGGTSLYGRWNPDWQREKADQMGEGEAKPLYPDMIAYVRQILSSYPKHGYEICGVLWVQGEKDSGVSAHGPRPAQQYGSNLANLIEHVRHDLGVPDLPFLFVQVGAGQVVEGMKEVARTVPNVCMIPQSNDLASPNHFPKYPIGHYNYEGQKRIGTLLAEAYLKNFAQMAMPTGAH